MRNVEDIYPLSPMQQTMLLHELSGAGDGVLFNQFCFDLRGPLDLDAFRESWGALQARHPVLRTAFVWQDVKQPLQLVRREVAVLVDHVDLTVHGEDEQQRRLEAYREEDRGRRFDLAKAPLNRLALLRRGDELHWLVWSTHHLLLDRFCFATVLEELNEFYDARCESRRARLAPAYAYRDYIGWIQRQPRARTQAFWRDALKGLQDTTPVTLRVERGRTSIPQPVQARAELSPELSARLSALARTTRLTSSTLVQGAWALALNRLTGSQDVVFGMAVSGRPTDLVGADAMLGSFVNNLPVRVRMPRERGVRDWLKTLQAEQQRRMRFEHASLADIHEWCRRPADQRLFDNLLVWLAPEAETRPRRLDFRGYEGEVRTAFPLTLSVAEERERITVRARCGAEHQTIAPLPEMLGRLLDCLERLARAAPACTLGELEGFVASGGATPEPAPSELDGGAGVDDAPDVEITGRGGGREGTELGLLEELLGAEWALVLGVNRVEPQDDFFQLGGNSLLAARLHTRVEASTRLAVPLLTLFQAPTVRAMAKTLFEKDWPLKPDIVLPVRLQGSAAPVFLVASPEANTIGYGLLARHVGSDHPVYVLQAPPDSAKYCRLSPGELPELARAYVDAMRRVQPLGPYHLLGMCTGAQTSVEMVRHLEAAGERAAFLGIVNTWAFFTISKLYHVQRAINRLRWYGHRAREVSALGFREQWAELKRIATRRFAHATSGVATVVSSNARSQPMAAPVKEWIEEVGWVEQDDERPRIASAATVFRTRRQRFWRINDRALGWGRHCEAVCVVMLRVNDQLSILREPHVRELAQRINKALSR